MVPRRRRGRGAACTGARWRIAHANHLHGDLDEVVRAYERSAGVPGEPKDEALLLAWTATAQVRLGETAAGAALAARALSFAERSGDAGALAVAHTAEALVAEANGDLDLSASHMRRALVAAERANDVLQLSRIRNNRASVLTTRGLYREAIGELELAISLAERVASVGARARADEPRLLPLVLGELDEANADYTAAIAVYRSSGGTEISYALIGRGDVYRERGDQAPGPGPLRGRVGNRRNAQVILQASYQVSTSSQRCSWTTIPIEPRISPNAPPVSAGPTPRQR